MIDRSALEYLQELVEAATASPATDIDIVLMPNGMKVESLEAYKHTPARMRQRFSTHDVHAFCDYVGRHAQETTTVYVAKDGARSVALIDHGSPTSPMWGEHVAEFRAEHTPAFDALLKACAVPLQQRDLINFIEDWRVELRAVADDGTDMELPKVLHAVRNVRILHHKESSSTDGNLKSTRTGFDDIEAKSGAGELPAALYMTCALYWSTSTRAVELRLLLRSPEAGKPPVFGLRIVGYEPLMITVADEIGATMRKRLQPAHVFFGQVKR